MEFDLSWLLLGLPLAFFLGWAASRFDLRQWRMENRQAPKAYFKGLNFLLNEQQDQAIDAFIEAVQNDPDTSELHFALGNLFRRRGEYERAVRVHEHLLSRADLSRTDRERAQHALALDFLKAGLLDRAEAALQKLEGTPFENQARLALLAIYERSRDWPQAAAIAQRMDQAGQGRFNTRQAHYLCEDALSLAAKKAVPEALELLAQARRIAPEAPRAYIEAARLLAQQGQHDLACDTLAQLADIAPSHLALAALPWAESARASQRVAETLQRLEASYQIVPSLDVLEALVMLSEAQGASEATARERYVQHLEREPSLVAAARWIAGEQLAHDQFHPQVQRALDHAAKPLTRYRCAACGFEAKQYFWQCPGCQSWDSYPAKRVEEL
ncbi:lipopolysaccharide assembly protein LapB [Curvibacter sp. HBC28]|uniref:Lipopolysaccharide assembly protein B n=1 Tax=Curvibacter microcysteis TaxID=3026419 RepID=A0ABT5MFL6_9BURK|nr:lipopolysaccharide assembly protein LapB [Curvibacter sp. HBC28]MDD0815366.1 lipopolysaccharide assembly protein LapB [Curvibacter sp. HBC28]